MKIFVDTSAILALLNDQDRFHESAKNEWTGIIKSDALLFSSNYIILETIAILQHRFGADAVRLFIGSIQPVINILWINEDLHNSALSIILTINNRDLSLVDSTSFEFMRKMELNSVFTFDRHFSEQGFKVVPG